ncbi:proton-conducting transporter transmembrane domain-containing protein [Stieleria varia]|uniref:NADH-quinone oxidoreductase subunit M n=1 Tax=Stieleria varia TaxID=2528005 RepID=A0A5C6B885_9BACT|nr:proton-conducting transporter membrane subunit [Stieleria varia]TWU08170.1 NADH-quinone oxidoreductase subunit M [Stieleria varia]
MPELMLPWLELSILIPLIGSLLVRFPRDRDLARKWCIVICSLALTCTVGEWIDFARMATFEAHDHWDALASIFHANLLVIDELNAPLLPLISLLFLLTVISTLRTKLNRFSLSGTLFYQAVLLATFSCRASWLLIALLIIGAIPPWFEMKYRRDESTRVYSIHMIAFAICMVLGYWLLPAGAEADPEQPRSTTLIAGALLTLGALLRNGIFPLHCWMTDLFQRATLGTALLHVLPMTGAYAVMRLVLPIAPSWALQSIAVLSLITAVYAAGRGLVETDGRKFFCYLLLSNSSLVLVGLELVTSIGLTGALCLWLSVGLSLGGLGLTLRCIEARIGRINLTHFHGLHEHTPKLAGLFLLTGLGAIGFPGTIGFIGTELLVEGAVGVYPVIGIAVVIAATINGIAIMQVYFRVFAGRSITTSIPFTAKPSERFAVVVLALLIIGGGLYPQPGISSRHHAAEALLEHRGVNKTESHHDGKHSQSAASEVQSDSGSMNNAETTTDLNETNQSQSADDPTRADRQLNESE